jgi:hypothetical protein
VKSFASFPNKASKSSTDANPKRWWSWTYSTQLSLPVFEGTPSMVPPVLHLLTALNIYIPPNIAFHYKQGFRTGGMPKLNAQSSGKAASAVSASNSMSTKPLISEQQHFNVVSPSTSLLDAKSSGKDKRELAYSVDLVSVSSVEELIGLSLIPGCEIMKHIPSMRSRFPHVAESDAVRFLIARRGNLDAASDMLERSLSWRKDREVAAQSGTPESIANALSTQCFASLFTDGTRKVRQ